MPEKVDQGIKQASRDESNDQAPILTIKFLWSPSQVEVQGT